MGQIYAIRDKTKQFGMSFIYIIELISEMNLVSVLQDAIYIKAFLSYALFLN